MAGRAGLLEAPMIEPLLFTATQVVTFHGQQQLTNATGFFFERDERLYLVTSRHVLRDEPTGHFPDRIELELISNPENVAESTSCSLPLYADGRGLWVQGLDAAGGVDVALLELDRRALPPTFVYRAFTPEHLFPGFDHVDVGTPLLVIGFPLGFHDTLHHVPVARQAIVASSFGLRFQGQGYFLTDARTHRGTSGAPVVLRAPAMEGLGDLPWILLGVHASRVDIPTRDQHLDEALGLNCAWYADILLTLSEPPAADSPVADSPAADSPPAGPLAAEPEAKEPAS